MALKPLNIPGPGTGGLNTTESVPATEDLLTFAAVASNAVLGKTGKLEAREDFVNQTSGYSSGALQAVHIHTSLSNVQTFISAAVGKMFTGKSTLTSVLDLTAGRQMIDVGGAKTGATATGLANDATTYGMLVSVDGAANTQVTVTGSAAQTYTTLLAEINADLTGATASLVAGNIEVKSNSAGGSISITNSAGTASVALCTTLTNFRALISAEAGSTTLNNWQWASLNGHLYAAQAGRRLRRWADSSFTTELAVTYPTSNYMTHPNCLMAAWGRLWTADDSTNTQQGRIGWSDLLTANFTGGDSGTIDLSNVWPDGADRVMALAQFSGRLVIFGRTSIVMYQMPSDLDPTNMSLLEPIRGVGCVARDGVVSTGNDLLFLSDQGVMSLQRLTTIASLPVLSNLTKNVQDDITTDIAAETATAIRAGYYPQRGWYLISFPTQNKTYCLDMLRRLADNITPRVTTWTNAGMPFRSFVMDNTGALYTGGTSGIYKYSGYTSDGASQAYSFSFFTPWLNFGDESILKLLKWVELSIKAGSGKTFTLSWRVNYIGGTTHTQTATCTAAEFAEDPGLGRVLVDIAKEAEGVTFQFGVTHTISGKTIELHTMRALASAGKVV